MESVEKFSGIDTARAHLHHGQQEGAEAPPNGTPQAAKPAVCAKKGLYEPVLADLEPSGGCVRGLRRSIVRPEAL